MLRLLFDVDVVGVVFTCANGLSAQLKDYAQYLRDLTRKEG